MSDELISKLRTATVADPAWDLYALMDDAAKQIELNHDLMGIIAEQAYEIDRLRKIIRNYYLEELHYQDQMSDHTEPDSTIPQTWKDAYRAFMSEALSIEDENA